MIMSRLWKVFGMLASTMLLCGGAAGQTPPQDQHSLPQVPEARTLLLDVDFKLNAGASSTKERLVSLSFTAREKSNNITMGDATANVTQYRVLESDSLSTDLSNQPWIPVTSRPPDFTLALRNARGQRFGVRRVVFQVKTDTLTSNVVSDTMNLDPVLKEYRVSASGNTHPLIQYAASQGFQFPLDFYETCKGECRGTLLADPDLGSGSAQVMVQSPPTAEQDKRLICVLGVLTGNLLTCTNTAAPAAAGTCTTKADYHLFFGRSPNAFWRIKSVTVLNAYVVPHGTNRFLAKFNFENKGATCPPPSLLSVDEVVVEGPEVDDFVDTANPWKNAFVRESARGRPSILPGIQP
jgi:hypothetical protein